MSAIFFVLGIVIGSFLNVCALRIPKGESFVWGRSHCPGCGQDLTWWQLIPLVSFILIRGKCAHCKAKVSWRYPLVELVTGVSFLLVYLAIGLSPQLIPALLLIGILIVVSLIDLDYQIIPNKLVAFGFVTGIPINLIFGRITWMEMLCGLLVGGGFLLLIALLSRGGMGGGDVKFTAMLGIYLGWQYTLETVFLASLFGAFVGIGLILTKGATRKTPIPFGPFLALSAYILCLWGPEVNNWYWAMLS